MKDEFLTLFETTKALVTYIDKEYVFDKASAMFLTKPLPGDAVVWTTIYRTNFMI